MAVDDSELNPRTYIPDLSPTAAVHQDYFIVCGLGSLGQQIIVNLTKFSFDSFEVQIAGFDPLKNGRWSSYRPCSANRQLWETAAAIMF